MPMSDAEKELWRRYSYEAADALGMDRGELLCIDTQNFFRRWGAVREAALSGALTADEARAAVFPYGDELAATVRANMSPDDLYRDCLNQAMETVPGLTLDVLTLVQPERLTRRWLAIRNAVMGGELPPEEARLMVVPELGEAWARAVFAEGGVLDPEPGHLGHLIGVVSSDIARQVREWLTSGAPSNPDSFRFMGREAQG